MKSVLKEIAIIILLCIAICLILCVIFYNYIPNNIVVPSTVEPYSTSGTIKNEINEEVAEYPKQNVVFEITDSDLTLYKQSQSYSAGKENPFATSSENAVSTNTTTQSGQASSGSQSTSSDNNVSSNENQNATSGTFFEDTHLK